MPQRPSFESLFRLSPNAYLLLDAQLVILDANPAYLRLTGRRLADILGQRVDKAFAADPQRPETSNVQELLDSFARVLGRKAMDTLPVIRYSITRETPRGAVYEDRYWSVTHTPVLDASGEVSAILQHATDITELQALKRSLGQVAPGGQPLQQVEESVLSRARLWQDEGAQLRRLFAQAPGFMCFLRGPEHVFELVNDAYQQLTGNRPLIGKTLREGLPELEGQALFGQLDQAYDTGEPFVGRRARVMLWREPDAGLQEVLLDFVFQPVFAADGSVSGIFVQGSDVTEQQRNEQALLEYRERLEELVRERTRELSRSEAERRAAEAALLQAQKLEALGKLTGGVAHDFNNMLQIIGGNLQLLRRSLGNDETAQRRLDSAVGGVEKGALLATQLLAFASRQALQPQSVRFGELLEQMSELLSGALGRGIQLQLEVEDGLWPVFADIGNLQTVILNLAGNARDAMQGSGRLVIGLRNRTLDARAMADHPTVEAGDYVELSVIDEGGGMTPAVRAQAFEPFFTTKQDSNASGLGLSMVYGFVRQSGGFIDIDSAGQHGTAVRVRLPRSPAGVSEFRGRDAHEQAAPDAGEPDCLRILFVEDDPTLRMLTAEVMCELGHRVSLSESAEEALEKLNQQRFDVLITDVGLAGMSGIELVRQARARDAGLAVVIASGYPVDAREEGLDALRTMLKPYDIQQVRELLGSIQAERASCGVH